MTKVLIVDLSKAEAGDIAVFRHGGRMPIGHIESFEVESHEGTNTGYFLRMGASPYTEIIGRFSRNGINEWYPHQNAYCEIVAVEKKL